MKRRVDLFRTALLRSTISMPVLAISICDRDRNIGHGFDLEAMTAPLLNPPPPATA